MKRHKVYRNLNIRDRVAFSVAYEGRVVEYRDVVILRDVHLKHATSEQASRIRSKCREVCAWLLGTLGEELTADEAGCLRRLACDPKKVDCFQDAETGERIDHANVVACTPEGTFYA